jgi:exopolysaccharide biosynthesis polyprenyl glycosylphosphotransferase
VGGSAPSIASLRPATRSVSLVLGERKLALIAADLAGLTVGLLFATQRLGVLRPETDWLRWLLLLWTIWIVSSAALDAYDLRVCSRPTHAVLAGYKPFAATFLIYLAIPYVTPPLLDSRLSIAIWAATSLFLIGASRLAYARLLTRPRFQRRAVVIGNPVAADELARALRADAPTDYTLLGWVSTGEGAAATSVLPALRAHTRLPELVHALDASEVILAGQGAVPPEIASDIVDLYNDGVEVTHMSDVFEQLLGRIPVAHVSDHWYAVLPRRAGGGRAYDALRRLGDCAISVIVLFLASPVFLAVALAIRVEGPGPVFYRQRRLGYLGRPFEMWKFRTMATDAERDGEEVWAARADPRCTRVGRLLRRTRLDELPQLWNVLSGEMTLIGPRPERPGLTSVMQERIPFYRSRLLVKPGLTGWAQVRFRYAGTVDESLEKLQYDLYYVKYRSPYLDLVIALKSIGVVLRASGT